MEFQEIRYPSQNLTKWKEIFVHSGVLDRRALILKTSNQAYFRFIDNKPMLATGIHMATDDKFIKFAYFPQQKKTLLFCSLSGIGSPTNQWIQTSQMQSQDKPVKPCECVIQSRNQFLRWQNCWHMSESFHVRVQYAEKNQPVRYRLLFSVIPIPGILLANCWAILLSSILTRAALWCWRGKGIMRSLTSKCLRVFHLYFPFKLQCNRY